MAHKDGRFKEKKIDVIYSPPANNAYRDNYDRIFRGDDPPFSSGFASYRKTPRQNNDVAKKITLNSAKCLVCNDVLVSVHIHDYQTCSCGNLSVDGGNEYLKRAAKDPSKVEELSKSDCDSNE